ncbi:BC1872 family protein [Paenibacillus chitinolyticus]
MTEQQKIKTIAVNVMEWEPETDFTYRGEVLHARCAFGHFTEWNPLQDIADMWQVLEKLREHYVNAGVFFEDNSGCWTGYAGSNGRGFIAVEAEGQSAQEAICNAALKTVPVT